MQTQLLQSVWIQVGNSKEPETASHMAASARKVPSVLIVTANWKKTAPTKTREREPGLCKDVAVILNKTQQEPVDGKPNEQTQWPTRPRNDMLLSTLQQRAQNFLFFLSYFPWDSPLSTGQGHIVVATQKFSQKNRLPHQGQPFTHQPGQASTSWETTAFVTMESPLHDVDELRLSLKKLLWTFKVPGTSATRHWVQYPPLRKPSLVRFWEPL